MSSVSVPLKRVTGSGDVIPSKAHQGDVGYDLKYCGEDVSVPTYLPGSSNHIVKLKTGVCIQAPPGTYIRIAPRSGLSSKGIIINGGVVDPGYQGEILVVAMNLSGEPFTFRTSDRVAQVIFESVLSHPIKFKIVDEFTSESKRGEQGFGSSG
jgi:dUTP pyrophosphatase